MRFFNTLMIMLLISIPTVFAIGIASDYIEDDTLYLKPGESFTYGVRLQNGGENEIRTKLILTSEIANIIDPKEIYILPPKSYQNKIFINVTIPKYTQIGKRFSVNYYTQPQGSGGGMIGFDARINKGFTVIVGEKASDYEDHTIELQQLNDPKPKENIIIPSPPKKKSFSISETQVAGIMLILIFFLALTPLIIKTKKFRQKDIYKFK